MTGLGSFSGGTLRRHISPRSVLTWFLLAVLVTGAASYCLGSRYAIVPGHAALYSAPHQDPAIAPSPANTASSSAAVGVIQHEPRFEEQKMPQQECCERRSAPRSEPAPLRTGVTDLPAMTHRLCCADGPLSAVTSPEPGPPALTIIQLSISRT